MRDVRQTEVFRSWLAALSDKRARAKILVRVERLARGNAGQVAPVGSGISELKIDFGPGYRVYFQNRGSAIVLLLCGGDKGTQDKDIARAKALARAYQE
jgi:putative addiction module killer protein